MVKIVQIENQFRKCHQLHPQGKIYLNAHLEAQCNGENNEELIIFLIGKSVFCLPRYLFLSIYVPIKHAYHLSQFCEDCKPKSVKI